MTIEMVGIVGLLIAYLMWKAGGFTRRLMIAKVIGLGIFLLMLASVNGSTQVDEYPTPTATPTVPAEPTRTPVVWRRPPVVTPDLTPRLTLGEILKARGPTAPDPTWVAYAEGIITTCFEGGTPIPCPLYK